MSDSNITIRKDAVLYARWSNDEQGKGASLKMQEDYANNMCMLHNLRLKTKYVDDGKSGFNRDTKRPALEKMFKELDGEVVLLHKIDRLSRWEVDEAMLLLRKVFDTGSTVICDGQILDKNTRSDIATIIKMWLANEESRNKSERIFKGIHDAKSKIKNGVAIAHNSMPDWIQVEDGKFKIIEEKANVIRRIFNLYNAGNGTYRIAKLMNAEGVTQPYRRWYAEYILRVLKNKSVLGHYYIDGVTTPDIYPAIIEEATFYATQKKIPERKKYKGKIGRMLSLFGSLLICKHCQKNLIQSGKSYQGQYEFFYYKCNRKAIGLCSCKKPYINGNWIHSAIKIIISNHLPIVEMLGNDKPVVATDLDILNQQMLDGRKQQAKITALICNDPEPSVNLYSRLKQLESEEKEILEQIEKANVEVKSYMPVKTAIAGLKKLITSEWTNKETRLKIRECLIECIEKIIVDMDNKSFVLYFKNAKHPVTAALHKDHCLINNIRFPYE